MSLKELENDLHEQLYNNLLVLTMEYSTTKEFQSNFRKDMFYKNNKTAFHHTIHFLLTILDPVAFKQRLCWPILDNKMEIQFRNELMKYINEFQTLYEDSNIPLLMTSHLISPGGYRFTEFMHKLSQFVLFKHLDDGNVLYPIKIENDPTIATFQLDKLHTFIDDYEDRLVTKQADYKLKHHKIVVDARTMLERKRAVEYSLFDVKKQFQELQQKTQQEVHNQPIQLYEEIIKNVTVKTSQLRLRESEFAYCKDLVDTLSMNRNILRYETPTHTCVNLVDLFRNLSDLLKSNKYVFHVVNNVDFGRCLSETEQVLDSLNICYDKYERLNSDLLDFVSKLQNISSSFKYNVGEDDKLFYEVKEIYQTVPFVNIRITNLY